MTGLKLEAVNPKDPSSICAATVSKVANEIFFQVEIDSLISCGDGSRPSMWCSSSSRNIFPVGWCARNNIQLTPPPGKLVFTCNGNSLQTNLLIIRLESSCKIFFKSSWKYLAGLACFEIRTWADATRSLTTRLTVIHYTTIMDTNIIYFKIAMVLIIVRSCQPYFIWCYFRSCRFTCVFVFRIPCSSFPLADLPWIYKVHSCTKLIIQLRTCNFPFKILFLFHLSKGPLHIFYGTHGCHIPRYLKFLNASLTFSWQM